MNREAIYAFFANLNLAVTTSSTFERLLSMSFSSKSYCSVTRKMHLMSPEARFRSVESRAPPGEGGYSNHLLLKPPGVPGHFLV